MASNRQQSPIFHQESYRRSAPYPIPYKLQVRYLGLTLDRRLWWHPHVQTMITKAKRHLGALVSATRGNWGPRPQIAHWIYVAMVCPSVTYAALVWAHDVELKKTRALLARLDKMAATAIAATKNQRHPRDLQWS